jgi:carboxylesterase
LHGFSSSPKDLTYLGDYLAKKGITVYAPLLKGHGTCVEHMSLTTHKDWLNDAEKALNMLKKRCKKVYIAGISVQGNTSAILAAKHNLDGIIFLGAPIFFKKQMWVNFGSLVLPIVRHFKPFYQKWYHKNLPDVLMKKRVTYHKLSLKSCLEAYKIIRISKKILPKIKCPALIMQTKTDIQVRDDSPKYIYDHIGSNKKKIVWLPASYHVFVIDKKKELAFREIYNFLKNN